MTRKARIWIGVTILIIIAFNYCVIGIPLMKKSASIKDKYKSILVKQAKSGDIFKSAEDEYLLEIFRKEKAAIDKKILILNCVGASMVIILSSWIIFGLVASKKKA
ncbi:MAG: hypothetical protein A2987_07040 [Omnitrophica bacterium RIFCSPLOWO2_01_FULL_45_10]|nr:MAG: hypothetical protein A2987_07040 [Omnitrophica bacterium RIFCSPLOWO2_01_FULL_45_10]